MTTIRELIAYKHGKHNQIVHGNRYGKAPSVSRARRLRKAGEWQKYVDTARQRQGKKPRKPKTSKPPKKSPKKRIGYRGLGTIPKRKLLRIGKGLEDRLREEIIRLRKETGRGMFDVSSPEMRRLERGINKIRSELRDRDRWG